MFAWTSSCRARIYEIVGGRRAQQIGLSIGLVLAPALTVFAVPDDVSLATAASGDTVVTLEWVNPDAGSNPDFDGVLVLRNTTQASGDAPTNGVSYNVGDTIGTSTVVCVTTSAATSCSDTTVSNAVRYYFTLFSFDTSDDYASGVETVGLPRSDASYKWAYATNAASLNPAGVVGAESVVGIGNDRYLHRMAETDGTRGGWDPPLVGGAVQSRPMVLDLDPDADGTRDDTAFVTGQDGYLYRFSLDSDGTAEASVDVAFDASCNEGVLQAAPVIMLDYYDANSNSSDDAVIVATRCNDVDSDGTLNENQILVYDHDLNFRSRYAGDKDDGGLDTATLGISNAAPRILYRDAAGNLIYVPVRNDGDDDESLVVLMLESDGTLPSQPYSEVTGIGDIDATPIVFDLANAGAFYAVVGNDSGTLYLYDAVNRTGGVATPLTQRDTYTPATADGSIKGISVSTPVPIGGGLFAHWVVWVTDTTVHGIPVVGGTVNFRDSDYWSASIAAPSTPVVLRGVGGSASTYAYVGSSDGRLYELDASDGTTNRSWLLESGQTIGDPTFDYNNGANQGIVVGSTSGLVHWVRID